jgi:chromosome segregation ATPase
MILRMVKYGVIGGATLLLVGAFMFGRDLHSYVSSSARSVRTAVKDAVPIEFELRRARDLVNDLVPEMQAHVRLIAQQEVEIAQLQTEIERSHRELEDERARVRRLRDAIATSETRFVFNGFSYTREQVREDLARRFDWLKEAEVVLTGKQRLLENRQHSLAAAMQTLERTRSQKSLLESQIAALEGQHRLVQAASAGSGASIDNSKLAQTERLITQIRKQLDVAERVLAHESRFVQPIQIDTINEKDLLTAVDEHLADGASRGADPVVAR